LQLTFRLAKSKDAAALCEMNAEFNGVQMEPAHITKCLSGGREIVVIAYENNIPVGFLCAKTSQSICYAAKDGVITEVYVRPTFRNKGAAHGMIDFAEKIMPQDS
jgi:ribosomal protein S18 acetylase RimI-like enzyme